LAAGGQGGDRGQLGPGGAALQPPGGRDDADELIVGQGTQAGGGIGGIGGGAGTGGLWASGAGAGDGGEQGARGHGAGDAVLGESLQRELLGRDADVQALVGRGLVLARLDRGDQRLEGGIGVPVVVRPRAGWPAAGGRSLRHEIIVPLSSMMYIIVRTDFQDTGEPG
jgi:hypothetical protein